MSAEGASVPLVLPKLGHSMEAATILKWHVGEGEQVGESQVLVTIETDKASYDIESPGPGVLHIVIPEGEEVAVDTLIASIGRVGVAAGETPSKPGATQAAVSTRSVSGASASPRARVLASPRAKRLAGELGIDIETVVASSSDGIISAEDVQAAATKQADGGPPSPAPSAAGPRREIARRKLAGIQRTGARRLQEAWQTIPHIVQMVDVDASGLLARRERLQREGIEASLNDLVLHATARALVAVPELNVRLEGEEIVSHEGADIGFAAETPRGLLVPVVRRADALTIGDLAAETRRLTAAAREGRLKPEEVGAASLTVSNLGAQGIRMGMPVINLGEPALVFVGAIESRPVAVGTSVVARPVLTLSIAYDHRVADGMLAASFTNALRSALESLAGEREDVPGRDVRRNIRSRSEGDGYRVDLSGPGSHRWALDEPVDEHGSDQGPTPVEALLGALVGCLTISFKAAARRRNIPIERIEGFAEANPRGHLSSISVHLTVVSRVPASQLEPLLPIARRGCYVSGALRSDLEYGVVLKVERPAQN